MKWGRGGPGGSPRRLVSFTWVSRGGGFSKNIREGPPRGSGRGGAKEFAKSDHWGDNSLPGGECFKEKGIPGGGGKKWGGRREKQAVALGVDKGNQRGGGALSTDKERNKKLKKRSLKGTGKGVNNIKEEAGGVNFSWTGVLLEGEKT